MRDILYAQTAWSERSLACAIVRSLAHAVSAIRCSHSYPRCRELNRSESATNVLDHGPGYQEAPAEDKQIRSGTGARIGPRIDQIWTSARTGIRNCASAPSDRSDLESITRTRLNTDNHGRPWRPFLTAFSDRDLAGRSLDRGL